MQLSRLAPRGLAALHHNSRFLLLAPRLLGVSPRIIRVSADAPSRDAATSQEGDARPASRRTLFRGNDSDAAPAEANDATPARRRELIGIHKESLREAGVKVDPISIQQNRLYSLKQAMRRDTRGAARAAVTREFKTAERRLFSQQRRARDGDDGSQGNDNIADGRRSYGTRSYDGPRDSYREDSYRNRERRSDDPEDHGGRGRGRFEEEDRGARGRGRFEEEDRGGRGRGRFGDEERGDRGMTRRGGFEEERGRVRDRFDEDRGARRVRFDNDNDNDEGQEERRGRSRDRFGGDNEWRGRDWGRDEDRGSRGPRGVSGFDEDRESRYGRRFERDDRRPGPRLLRDRESEGGSRERGSKERKEKPPKLPLAEQKRLTQAQQRAKREALARMTPEERAALEEKNKRRAAVAAATAVAAVEARRRAFEAKKSGAGAPVGDVESDDEDEMEEGEVGELFDLQSQIDAVGEEINEASGKVRPVTDLMPKEKRGPLLSHNLPSELNKRLLETVLLGAKHAKMPEIPMGHSGITKGILAAVHLGWRGNELVKLRIRDRRKTAKKYLPFIKEVCEELESLLGGVVVWRSGRSIWMYRGQDYKPMSQEVVLERFLGKKELPLDGIPLITNAISLGGQLVEIPGAGRGYLTRGPGAPRSTSTGADSAAASSADAAASASSASQGAATMAGASTSVQDAPADTAAAASSSSSGTGQKKMAVLFLHEAFGMETSDSKHTKRACDRLAQLLGPDVPVLMPDLVDRGKDAWRGPDWPPAKAIYERHQGWLQKSGRGNWMAVAGIVDAAVAYLRGPEVGATHIVLAGTGWGAWLATHALMADTAAAAAAAAAAAPAAPAEADAATASVTAMTSGAGAASPPAAPAGPLAAVSANWPAYAVTAREAVAENSPAVAERLTFQAALLVSANHFFTDEERLAPAISVPIAIMSSKWDPMEKFQLLMNERPLGHSAFKRFGKLLPGFLGKKAKWEEQSQATQATQALVIGASFLRWRVFSDEAAEEVVRRYCMMSRSGVGEKQVYNLNFPWLPRPTLFRGREKQEKRAKEAEERAKKEAEKAARLAAGEEIEEEEEEEERRPKRRNKPQTRPSDRWIGRGSQRG
ncbi:hypothetical protein Agub_g5473 [Astrephomene gubernaculifera]|uniref:CRM domain-containing protein n=1 Tax=Astrephomene gubernaculifera TaxID=47775 RepID=A0AAD3HKQ4_9CHLO|nr:hypothetical protein Agub_g5473 [Astrephomene gubernaculifera]